MRNKRINSEIYRGIFSENNTKEAKSFREGNPFAEVIGDLYYKMYPKEYMESLDTDIESAKDNLIAKEETISELSLKAVLEEYGIDTSEIKRNEDGFFEIPVSNHFDTTKKLPKGYAYKGGAARALLVRSLGIDPSYQPRDIDVVRIIEIEPQDGLDE